MIIAPMDIITLDRHARILSAYADSDEDALFHACRMARIHPFDLSRSHDPFLHISARRNVVVALMLIGWSRSRVCEVTNKSWDFVMIARRLWEQAAGRPFPIDQAVSAIRGSRGRWIASSYNLITERAA